MGTTNKVQLATLTVGKNPLALVFPYLGSTYLKTNLNKPLKALYKTPSVVASLAP